MSYIIFGGSGFVGRYLTDKLAEESPVIVCDLVKPEQLHNENITYLHVDVRDEKDFEKIPLSASDIVINLAANQYHTKVPKKGRNEFFSDTNTRGVRNILSWMESKGAKNMIQYTTDMTYGMPHYLPVDSKHPQQPFGPYGQSKKEAEGICRQYREKGFHITIFRPRMINGPGRLGILKKLFVLVRCNLPVPTIGNGKNCYQMISVFDCVDATIAAINKGCPNKEYNLGSENAPSTKVLLMGLIKAVGSKSVVLPTPGKLVKFALSVLGALGLEIMYKEQYMIADQDYMLDISETKADLEWTPKYNDQDMIIEAYREWSHS